MRYLGLLVVVFLAACSTAPAEQGPRFDDQGQQDISCMQHQAVTPGPRYMDPGVRRTDETLPMLRYYTVNAKKSYCDGQGPTDADRQWARLYVDLGADRANVAALLA
jgi:hypothetical protein